MIQAQSARYIMFKDTTIAQAVFDILESIEQEYPNGFDFIVFPYMINSSILRGITIPYEIHKFENKDQLFVYFLPKIVNN